MEDSYTFPKRSVVFTTIFLVLPGINALNKWSVFLGSAKLLPYNKLYAS
jgi:hypothetical protein